LLEFLLTGESPPRPAPPERSPEYSAYCELYFFGPKDGMAKAWEKHKGEIEAEAKRRKEPVWWLCLCEPPEEGCADTCEECERWLAASKTTATCRA